MIANRSTALLLPVILLGIAGCQDPPVEGARSRTVTVTGTGEAQAAPDEARVSAGVQSVAKTVTAASQQNEATVRKIMDALAQQGIEKADIGTTDYSIWAQQNYEAGEMPQITGYHVSNVVVVKIKEIAKIGDVLAAVTNAGANAVHGIQFSVADTAALEEEARRKAMADARRRAESLAGLANVELGEVVMISTSPGGGYAPMLANAEMRMAADAAPAPTITPGQQSVHVQVQVTYALD